MHLLSRQQQVSAVIWCQLDCHIRCETWKHTWPYWICDTLSAIAVISSGLFIFYRLAALRNWWPHLLSCHQPADFICTLRCLLRAVIVVDCNCGWIPNTSAVITAYCYTRRTCVCRIKFVFSWISSYWELFLFMLPVQISVSCQPSVVM